MQKIWNLIKLDIITMNGGKNNMKMLLVLLFLICGVMGFFLTPIFGLECVLIMGIGFVPTLFQNEIKYNSKKLHSLLPVSRRDLVNARFLFVILLYTALFLAFYLLMLLAQQLKLGYMIMGEEIASRIDMIARYTEQSDGAFTEFGVFNLLYFAGYAFGLLISASSLKSYFKDSESINFSLSFGKKKNKKQEYTLAIVILVVLGLWVLVLTDILPITTMLYPLMQLFGQLAQAANGFLLGSVMVAIALFMTIYQYICAILEYDEKEL